MYQLRYDLANEIYIKSLNDIEDFILKTLKEELSPEYFEVLLAVDSLDLSYKETSTMLDLPMGTVMSRVHRARKVARSVLKSRELTLKSLNL
jgi:RNA polymerase sigma-70 factor (ECF subfamily)